MTRVRLVFYTKELPGTVVSGAVGDGEMNVSVENPSSSEGPWGPTPLTLQVKDRSEEGAWYLTDDGDQVYVEEV